MPTFSRRFWFLLLLAVSAAGAVFLRVFPLIIVQPFKRQDPVQLQRALLVIEIAPRLSLALACVAVAAGALLFRNGRIWQRVLSVALVVIACTAAGLSRVNVFERMFHPAGAPQFLVIADSKVAPDDMLIAVFLHGQAHAYPIREMAYHHVVNDWVGSTPIVATY